MDLFRKDKTKYISWILVLVISYSVLNGIRIYSKSNVDWLYINLLAILVIVAIFILEKISIIKYFELPNKNNIKRFKFTDKMFFVFSVYIFMSFLEDMCSIFAPGISGNQDRNNDSLKDNPIWYSIFDSSVSAPIIEEVIFRGVIYLTISLVLISVSKSKHRVCRFINERLIGNTKLYVYITFILISSVYFGYKHVEKSGDFQYIWTYIASGLVLSIVYLITKNILYTIFIHGISNTFAVLNNIQAVGISSYSGDIGALIELAMYLFVAIYFVSKMIKHRKELDSIETADIKSVFQKQIKAFKN